MSIIALILLFFVTGLSSFVQRISGFGFAIVLMTVLPYIMPSYAEAVTLCSILAGTSALMTAMRYRKHFVFKKFIIIMISAMIAAFFAIMFLNKVNGGVIKKVLGVVLVLLGLFFIFFKDKIVVKPTVGAQLGLGSLAGIMGGLFAMQGPPAIIYFMGASSDKEEYVALTQWFFFWGNLIMSLYRAAYGMVTLEVGKTYLIAIPATFVGLYLGSKVFYRLKPERLRKIIYAFLVVSGVFAVLL